MRSGSETNTRKKTKYKAICLQEVCHHARPLELTKLVEVYIHVWCGLVESRNYGFSTWLSMNFNERTRSLEIGNTPCHQITEFRVSAICQRQSQIWKKKERANRSLLLSFPQWLGVWQLLDRNAAKYNLIIF